MPRYTITLIQNHGKLRMDFFNNSYCGKFINGTWQTTINQGKIMSRNRYLKVKFHHSQFEYKNLSCAEFITVNGFYSKHITDLEYNNPMAFSILVYKNLYQFQVLMRTLYVRSNFHCIHVDKEASFDLYAYVVKLSTCLENVHIVHPRLEVSWGAMTILEVERHCQRYLLQKSSKWHYYMTIAVSFLISVYLFV